MIYSKSEAADTVTVTTNQANKSTSAAGRNPNQP